MAATPGLWHVELGKGSYQRPAMVLAGKKLVASCMGNQLEPSATSIGESEANAQLIALTPELLEACRKSFHLLTLRLNLADIADDEKLHWSELGRLLAKATGD